MQCWVCAVARARTNPKNMYQRKSVEYNNSFIQKKENYILFWNNE